mgnify:CR=1 FL=1
MYHASTASQRPSFHFVVIDTSMDQAEARRMVDQDATAAVPAQVTLLSRHDIVVKQFDLNLEWVR